MVRRLYIREPMRNYFKSLELLYFEYLNLEKSPDNLFSSIIVIEVNILPNVLHLLHIILPANGPILSFCYC